MLRRALNIKCIFSMLFSLNELGLSAGFVVKGKLVVSQPTLAATTVKAAGSLRLKWFPLLELLSKQICLNWSLDLCVCNIILDVCRVQDTVGSYCMPVHCKSM